AEYGRVQRLVRFYDAVRARFDPGQSLQFTPIALPALYETDTKGIPVSTGDSGDDVPGPLRGGVAAWLHALRNPTPGDLPVRQLAANRDTKGVLEDGSSASEALRESVMRTSQLRPTVAETDTYRDCPGSSWTSKRRVDNFLRVISNTVVDGEPGITIAALSGNGSFSFPCWAPGRRDRRPGRPRSSGGRRQLHDRQLARVGGRPPRAGFLGAGDPEHAARDRAPAGNARPPLRRERPHVSRPVRRLHRRRRSVDPR